MSSSDNGSRCTLLVDGETFTVTVRPEDPDTCDYDWISGPNPGYGFSSSKHVAYFSIRERADTPTAPLPPSTISEHREAIRDFLSQIDPETGYLED
ncbi:hypothetical protein [Rhodococcus sp. NPDC058521]|uniref:hypothetical protein n=1 Tax=Rhodococcus sp. NPDC058521 TaxID=3346536 RepID=UPI00365FDD6C